MAHLHRDSAWLRAFDCGDAGSPVDFLSLVVGLPGAVRVDRDAAARAAPRRPVVELGAPLLSAQRALRSNPVRGLRVTVEVSAL